MARRAANCCHMRRLLRHGCNDPPPPPIAGSRDPSLFGSVSEIAIEAFEIAVSAVRGIRVTRR